MPEDKVRRVLKIAKEPISMETPIGDDEDSHLGDFIEDTNSVSPIEAVIMRTLKDHTENVLKSLTPREEQVRIVGQVWDELAQLVRLPLALVAFAGCTGAVKLVAPPPSTKMNAWESDTEIWLFPERKGLEPGYQEANFSDDDKRGRLRLIASSGQVVADRKGMDEWGNYPLERQRRSHRPRLRARRRAGQALRP